MGVLLGGGGGGVVSAAAEEYILIRDEKTAGTQGGTFTSGAVRTRDLNTIVIDNTTGTPVSLNANEFTLQAGIYRYDISMPFFETSSTNGRLFNVTDVAVVADSESTSGFCDVAAANDQAYGDPTRLIGEFTIAGVNAFRCEHQCFATKTTTGFGQQSANGNLTQKEVFTVVKLWRRD